MRRFVLFTLGCCIIVTGCASGTVSVQREEAFTAAMMHSLACMPFIKARQCGETTARKDTLLDCSLSSIVYFPESYAPDAVQHMSLLLYQEVKKKFGAVVRGYSIEASLDEAQRPHNDITLRSSAIAFAEKHAAEYVCVGVLDRYRERRGTARGIHSPASVAFSLYVLHAPTGATVFKASFNETQQALSENILRAPSFFKRGVRWLSAEELAREGIVKILAGMK